MNETQAYLSSTTGSTHPDWVMDTSVSHHITSNIQNLHAYSEYTGTDDVIVGDGCGIKITHTGHSTLPTPLIILF